MCENVRSSKNSGSFVILLKKPLLNNFVFNICQIYVIMNMYTVVQNVWQAENRRTVELYNLYQQKSVRYGQNLKKGTVGLPNGTYIIAYWLDEANRQAEWKIETNVTDK